MLGLGACGLGAWRGPAIELGAPQESSQPSDRMGYRLDAREVEEAPERRSGLLGLAGTSDMKLLLERRGNYEEDRQETACLAIEVYLHRLRAKIVALSPAPRRRSRACSAPPAKTSRPLPNAGGCLG